MCKPEVLWRLANLKNLQGIDWLKLVLWSSGRRLTREASVDNPICKYGTPFFKPTPLICIEKKRLKQAFVRFLAKQENLRDTGRLHALIHIFVSRSDAQAKLSDSISRYRKPFMQTDGLICVLHPKKPEVLWRLAKLKNLRGID